jgi:hypothetical protein
VGQTRVFLPFLGMEFDCPVPCPLNLDLPSAGKTNTWMFGFCMFSGVQVWLQQAHIFASVSLRVVLCSESLTKDQQPSLSWRILCRCNSFPSDLIFSMGSAENFVGFMKQAYWSKQMSGLNCHKDTHSSETNRPINDTEWSPRNADSLPQSRNAFHFRKPHIHCRLHNSPLLNFVLSYININHFQFLYNSF